MRKSISFGDMSLIRLAGLHHRRELSELFNFDGSFLFVAQLATFILPWIRTSTMAADRSSLVEERAIQQWQRDDSGPFEVHSLLVAGLTSCR